MLLIDLLRVLLVLCIQKLSSNYFFEKVLRFKNGEKVEKCATPWFSKIIITLKNKQYGAKKYQNRILR